MWITFIFYSASCELKFYFNLKYHHTIYTLSLGFDVVLEFGQSWLDLQKCPQAGMDELIFFFPHRIYNQGAVLITVW